MLFVFFDDTATTEVYTYGHTLSLPDALPICYAVPPDAPCRPGRAPPSPAGRAPARRAAGAAGHRRRSAPPSGAGRSRSSGTPCWSDGGWPARRSEEHTSELQSLMRISYAVFCLQKTNHYTHQITQELQQNEQRI